MKQLRSLIDSKKRAEVKKALAEGRLDKLLERKKAEPEPVQPKPKKVQSSLDDQKKLDEELLRELSFRPTPDNVEALLKKGANPDARNDKTETALMVAVISYENTLGNCILVLRGVPVESAIQKKHETGTKVLGLLLASGADVNAANCNGGTAWDYARESREHIRELFKKYGARGC